MLAQVIYLSDRAPKCSDEEITKILETSRINNGQKNITGVLLYSKTKFIQVLEGDKNDILALYDEIKKDERHRNVAMISLSPIKERFFPSWQMGEKKFDTESVEFISKINAEDRNEFKEILDGKKQTNVFNIIKKLF